MSSEASNFSASCGVRRSNGGLVISNALGISVFRGCGQSAYPTIDHRKMAPAGPVTRPVSKRRPACLVSMRRGGGGPDAGLGADVLCIKAVAVESGTLAPIQDGEQPDARKRDRH